jgi:hypothetical protein
MKASDYVVTYNIYLEEGGKEHALFNVFKKFIFEIEELAEKRKSKTDATFKSILKEQDMKWRSICNKISGLNKEGFVEYFKREMNLDIY